MSFLEMSIGHFEEGEGGEVFMYLTQPRTAIFEITTLDNFFYQDNVFGVTISFNIFILNTCNS
jgi:hypothetical protein